MGISKNLKTKIATFTDEEKDRLVRMGWEDRTTFDVIESQFQLTHNEFIRFMRTQLDRSSFDRWRKRAVEHSHLKHDSKNEIKWSRFKCKEQRLNGIPKRKK